MKNIKWLICIVLIAALLRNWKLGEIPISLHGDEVGVGYNAFTLLSSGLDEYGRRLPVSFRADVTPLIFYSTIPAIAMFGPTDFAVRFPSMLIGIITVTVFYFLIFEISSISYIKQLLSLGNPGKIALTATLLLSIAPWHIQISRIAHDAGYGILLQMISVLIFLRSMRHHKPYLYYLSIISFVLSMYAYHGPRLTSPLLLALLIYFFRKQLPLNFQLKTFAIFILCSTPLVLDFFNKPLSETRIGGINIINRASGENFDLLKIPTKVLFNLIRQFDIQLLFINSQAVRYFNVFRVGLMYFTQLPTLFVTLLLVKKGRFIAPLLLIILISVLPGALTSGPPNAGRILMLFPILEILTVIGITKLIQLFKTNTKVIVIAFLAFIYSLQFGFFLEQYFNDSPKRFTIQWQSGMKDLAFHVLKEEANYSKIIISDEFKQAYIYILFYGRKPIELLLQQPHLTRHSFIGYKDFGKYEFRKINWLEDQQLTKTLIVGTKNDLPAKEVNSQIYNPIGQIVASVISLN